MQFKPAKKLGFGLMRMPRIDPNDAAAVDVEQVKQMVDLFMEWGFTYFDTAWMYNGFASEPTAKEALTSRYPRESFTLATKLHNGFFNSLEGRDEIFNAQLEKCGVEYFDYYLLHGIEASSLPHYEKFDCFQWLLDKRDAGLARHVGFSYHDSPELLDEILTRHPEMEFVQLQINYLDWESEWIQSRACYEVATKHGKPVIVMEPVKGGTLASLAEVEDNLSYMDDFRPLTEAERDVCFQVADIINAQTAIACTACHYCTDGCPMRICIPEYFSLYNEDMRDDLEHKGWTINFTNYEKLADEFGRASDCIGCGQCEEMCPQHLPIIETLEKVAEHFE